MDGGVLVEDGTPQELLDRPEHERAKAFLNSVLRTDTRPRTTPRRRTPAPSETPSVSEAEA